MSKTTFKRILWLILIALFTAFGLLHLEEVLGGVSTVFSIFSPVFIGIGIAFTVNIPLRVLEKGWNLLLLRHPKQGKGKIREKLRRPVCMVLSFLLIAGLLFAVIFMLVPQMGVAFNDFGAMLPGYLRDLEALWTQAQTFLSDFGIVIPDFALDVSAFTSNEVLGTIKNFFTEWGTHILDKTVDITTSVFSGVFNVVLALVFSIYMLAQKEFLCHHIRRALSAVVSERWVDKLAALAGLINKTFTNFITGQLTEAVIIGVLCFIGMTVLRIPYAFVVSVIVGFTALIPVFGAYVGTAVGALLILLAEPIKAVWFVIFIVVLQQLEGNLIYPRVVGKSVGLPGLLVLAAVTVGSSVGGILGMLLAVPVCSVLFALCNQYIDTRLQQKAAASASVPPAPASDVIAETVVEAASEPAVAAVQPPKPSAVPGKKKRGNRKKKK